MTCVSLGSWTLTVTASAFDNDSPSTTPGSASATVGAWCGHHSGPRKAEENPKAKIVERAIATQSRWRCGGWWSAITRGARTGGGATLAEASWWKSAAAWAGVPAKTGREASTRLGLAGGLEAFKRPLDVVAVFRLVVFRADLRLFTVDIKGPKFFFTGFDAINCVHKPLVRRIDVVVGLQQF